LRIKPAQIKKKLRHTLIQLEGDSIESKYFSNTDGDNRVVCHKPTNQYPVVLHVAFDSYILGITKIKIFFQSRK